jgi:hypothetical protein
MLVLGNLTPLTINKCGITYTPTQVYLGKFKVVFPFLWFTNLVLTVG